MHTSDDLCHREPDGRPVTAADHQLLPPGDLLGEAEQISDGCLLSVLDAPWLLSSQLRPIAQLTDDTPVGSQAVLQIGHGLVVGEPDDLLAAAARRGRLQEAHELSRRLALEQPPARLTGLLFLPCTLDLLASRAGRLRLGHEVRAAGLSPTDVVLELGQHSDLHGHSPTPPCEHAVAHQVGVAAERLRDDGFAFAAGDAGEGWSSLDLLSALEPEVVVLSADLVSRLPGAAARAGVRALVALAAETGARTVADAVDTPERAVALRALGVDWARSSGSRRPA